VRVVVDVGVVHGAEVVFELEEEVPVSVLQFGALVAPRVLQQDVASAAKELEVVDHDVGVVLPDNAFWLARPRFSRDDLLVSLVFDEGVPEGVWLDVALVV